MKKRILSMLLVLCTVLGMFPVLTATPLAAEAAQAEQPFPYWELYVKDGLTMLLDAYDPANGTVDLLAGTWTSRVANRSGVKATAILDQPAGSSWWQTYASGVGYDMTYQEMASVRVNNIAGVGAKVGLDLGIANLPDGDYTFEMVLNPKGCVEADNTLSTVAGSSTLTFIWYGMSFGTMKGWYFPTIRLNDNGTHNGSESYNIRWRMVAGQYDYSNNSWINDYSLKVHGNALADTQYKPYVITYAATMDETVTAGESGDAYTGVFKTYQNSTLKNTYTMNNTATVDMYTYIPKSQGTSNMYFNAMYGYPATMYAIRVYDRVLTDAERLYNHGVDILAYYDIDLELPEQDRQAVIDRVVNGVSSYTFQTGSEYDAEREAIQSAVDAMLLFHQKNESSYLPLYVQDGLEILLTAFSANDSYDLTTGTWKSAVGSKSATLYNGSAATAWQVDDALCGGLSYVASTRTETGIRFDYADLPEDDFTFEILVRPDRLTDPSSANNGSCAHTFAFGPMKAYGWPKATGGTATYTNLDLLWYYSISDHSDANTLVKPMWAIRDSVFNWSNGKCVGYSVTFDRTATGSGYSGRYTILQNATAIVSDGDGKNPLDIPTEAYCSNTDDRLTETYRLFYAMTGFPGAVWAVRLYNRVLSEEEMAWNHAVDVAAYYALDLSRYTVLSEQEREYVKPFLAEALRDATLDKEGYMLSRIAWQNVVESAMDAYEVSESKYWMLYAQSGLTILLSAFESNGTFDLTTGTWKSAVGSKSATLYNGSATTAWRVDSETRGGLSYTASAGTETGIRFDYADLPEDDFTFEILVRPDRLTDPSSANNGSCAHTFAFGPLKAWGWPKATGGSSPYTNTNLLWYYGIGNHTQSTLIKNETEAVMWAISDGTFYYHNGEAFTYAVTFDRTATAGGYAGEYTFRKNTAFVRHDDGYSGRTVPLVVKENEYRSNTASDLPANMRLFYAMTGFPGAVWAVRLYNRVLSEEEMAWNHAVDVAAYYRLDLSCYFDLPETEQPVMRESLASLLADVSLEDAAYETTKAALQQELDGIRIVQRAESLVVTDGLTMWLSAYNANLSTGTWQSKVGTAAAELDGKWHFRNGGISYSLSSVGDSNGINMGIANLPDDRFTVEMVLTPHGLTNANGSKVTFDNTYGLSYPYGFAFGAFKGYVYPGQRAEGNSSPTPEPRYCTWQTMWYYAAQGHNFTWLGDDYSFNTYIDRPLTYTVTGTVDDAAKTAVYNSYHYGTKSNTVNINSTQYASVAESDQMFKLLYSFPATLYSVRVYDRMLSDTERAQNHFADLLAYLKLDLVDAFNALPVARRNEVVLRFADAELDEEGLALRIRQELEAVSASDLLIPNPTTEEELMQNHFAELALYYQWTLHALVGMDQAEMKAFFAKFACMDTSYTKEEGEALYLYHTGDSTAMAKALLSYEGLSVRMGGEHNGIRSLYTLNVRLLELLERSGGKATVGALMGVGQYGEVTPNASAADLQLSGSYATGYTAASPNSALVVVHATDNGEVLKPTNAYTESTAELRTFAYTTVLSDAMESREYYEIGLVYAGFVTVVNGDGEEHVGYAKAEGAVFGREDSIYGVATSIADMADYFVNRYQGTNAQMYYYWSSERLNHVMQACGLTVDRTVENEAARIAVLQAEMTDAYSALAGYPVYTCGVDAADGTKAIWVDYLPEKDPWPGNADADRAAVKALYIYYPCTYDPSTLNDAQLAEQGAVRVFGYMGVPAGKTEQDGIVCVHGGAGQAYANYVLEAMKNGYAAIALDTEGCYNTTGGTTTYSESGGFYQKDALGHMGKDSFSTVKEPLEQQWLYWAVGDTVMANSVLRAQAAVKAENVGLTGISWGGLIVSTTICYDDRFAFCVPVYISFHMAESYGVSVGGLPTNPFAAALWQDPAMLGKSTVPTMILSSANDLFASVDTIQKSYEDLQQGYLNIKPGLGHSQGAGASPSEIYRFGQFILHGGDGNSFITPDAVPDPSSTAVDMTLTVPGDLTEVQVTLYYRTEPLQKYSNASDLVWQSMALNYNRATGKVTGNLPEGVVMYYISFCGYSQELNEQKATMPYHDAFKGYIYSSTPLVTVD